MAGNGRIVSSTVTSEIENHLLWINAKLKLSSRKTVLSLQSAYSDGITLVLLIEELTRKNIPYINRIPLSKNIKRLNLEKCISFLKLNGILIENITVSELINGSLHAALILTRILRARFDIQHYEHQKHTQVVSRLNTKDIKLVKKKSSERVANKDACEKENILSSSRRNRSNHTNHLLPVISEKETKAVPSVNKILVQEYSSPNDLVNKDADDVVSSCISFQGNLVPPPAEFATDSTNISEPANDYIPINSISTRLQDNESSKYSETVNDDVPKSAGVFEESITVPESRLNDAVNNNRLVLQSCSSDSDSSSTLSALDHSTGGCSPETENYPARPVAPLISNEGTNSCSTDLRHGRKSKNASNDFMESGTGRAQSVSSLAENHMSRRRLDLHVDRKYVKLKDRPTVSISECRKHRLKPKDRKCIPVASDHRDVRNSSSSTESFESSKYRAIERRVEHIENKIDSITKHLSHLSKKIKSLSSPDVCTTSTVDFYSDNFIDNAVDAVYDHNVVVNDDLSQITVNLEGNMTHSCTHPPYSHWKPDTPGILGYMTHSQRYRKLKWFFGEDPPFLYQFLEYLGYEMYADKFLKKRFGIQELVASDESTLKGLGIPKGPRIRLLKALAENSSFS